MYQCLSFKDFLTAQEHIEHTLLFQIHTLTPISYPWNIKSHFRFSISFHLILIIWQHLRPVLHSCMGNRKKKEKFNHIFCILLAIAILCRCFIHNATQRVACSMCCVSPNGKLINYPGICFENASFSRIQTRLAFCMRYCDITFFCNSILKLNACK